jgi:hypothetical protein
MSVVVALGAGNTCSQACMPSAFSCVLHWGSSSVHIWHGWAGLVFDGI